MLVYHNNLLMFINKKILTFESTNENIYFRIKKLLINSFDNNLFFRTDNEYYEKITHVIGIKCLYYYCHIITKFNYTNKKSENIWNEELFFGINNIYIFHNSPLTADLNLPNYIINSNLPIILIRCDLNEFIKIYPEFIDSVFDDFNKYYSYANSLNKEIYEKTCRCNNLIGSNILPNLIIGESFDFDKIGKVFNNNESNEYCKTTFDALLLNDINSIINVYKSHEKLYSSEITKKLLSIGIEIYSFPIDECETNSETDKNNLYLAAEKINYLISNNKKIYLHCQVGKNRSISVALLYMVKYLKIPLKIACEEIYLKKSFAPQIKFIVEIWNESKSNEENPIALCKIISDVANIGNSFSLFGLGFYDVHKLDVISGKKTLPLVNDYQKIKQYLKTNNI